jgi:hypothetical protein
VLLVGSRLRLAGKVWWACPTLVGLGMVRQGRAGKAWQGAARHGWRGSAIVGSARQAWSAVLGLGQALRGAVCLGRRGRVI